MTAPTRTIKPPWMTVYASQDASAIWLPATDWMCASHWEEVRPGLAQPVPTPTFHACSLTRGLDFRPRGRRAGTLLCARPVSNLSQRPLGFPLRLADHRGSPPRARDPPARREIPPVPEPRSL